MIGGLRNYLDEVLYNTTEQNRKISMLSNERGDMLKRMQDLEQERQAMIRELEYSKQVWSQMLLKDLVLLSMYLFRILVKYLKTQNNIETE